MIKMLLYRIQLRNKEKREYSKDIKSVEFLVQRKIYIVVWVESEYKVFYWLGIYNIKSSYVNQETVKYHSIGWEIVVDQWQMENKLERVDHSPKVLERLSPTHFQQKLLTSQDSLQNLQLQLMLLHLTLTASNFKDFKLLNLKIY